MVVQGKARRICAAYESTLSTADAVPLPHAGKAYKVSQSPVIPLISAVLYYDTSSPVEKGRAKGAGWIHEAV